MGDARIRGVRRSGAVLCLAIAGVALIACIVGGGLVAFAADGTAIALLGLVALIAALVACAAVLPRAAALGALVGGAALTAEGLAVSWLGHMGALEVLPGLLLLLAGIVGGVVAHRPVRRGRRAVLATVVLALGGTALVAGLLGMAGEALEARLSPGGSTCLPGFAGDPSTHPRAPADASAIRSGFTWWPIGRTCSWAVGLPAATNGAFTVATVAPQTDPMTSRWIYGTGAAGAVLLLAGLTGTAGAQRLRTARTAPGSASPRSPARGG